MIINTACPYGESKECSRNGLVSIPRIIGNILHVKVMIVGQNPGFSTTDKPDTHIAFEGTSFTCDLIEQCLDGFTDIYLTNVVKCADKNGIDEGESDFCVIKYLLREISFIRPKCVICLGRMPEKYVEIVKDIIGANFSIQYFIHPGALLRNNAPKSEVNKYITKMRNTIGAFSNER